MTSPPEAWGHILVSQACSSEACLGPIIVGHTYAPRSRTRSRQHGLGGPSPKRSQDAWETRQHMFWDVLSWELWCGHALSFRQLLPQPLHPPKVYPRTNMRMRARARVAKPPDGRGAIFPFSGPRRSRNGARAMPHPKRAKAPAREPARCSANSRLMRPLELPGLPTTAPALKTAETTPVWGQRQTS